MGTHPALSVARKATHPNPLLFQLLGTALQVALRRVHLGHQMIYSTSFNVQLAHGFNGSTIKSSGELDTWLSVDLESMSKFLNSQRERVSQQFPSSDW